MRIAVVGGDRRFDLLTEMLALRHDVVRDPDSLEGVDAVVAKGEIAAPPQVRKITMGGSGTDLMQDGHFVRENAALTAEGALCAAMNSGAGAVRGSICLVIGYGRIAQALHGMLSGMGARVIVAARREAARAMAAQSGAEVVSLAADELDARLRQADYIFSTPPAMILTELRLRAVRPGVPVIDLASPPYGVDLQAAQRLGVRAWRESGLPGRYCPAAAARLMAETVEGYLAQ